MIPCQCYVDRGRIRSVVVKSENVKLESVKSSESADSGSVTAESVKYYDGECNWCGTVLNTIVLQYLPVFYPCSDPRLAASIEVCSFPLFLLF